MFQSLGFRPNLVLEHGDAPPTPASDSCVESAVISTDSNPSSPQEMVDRLRASIAEVNRALEARS